MPRNAWRHIPAFCFALLVVVFLYALLKAENPAQKPSPLMGKPVPSFNLATLQGKSESLKDSDLTKNGRVSAVNFFASWCATCAGEQRYLSALRDDFDVIIYGIAYKDSVPPLKKWLMRNGNPFKAIGLDPDGRAAIDFGVTGVPETFLIGKDGLVLYRHVGPVDQAVIENIIAPLLRAEAKK